MLCGLQQSLHVLFRVFDRREAHLELGLRGLPKFQLTLPHFLDFGFGHWSSRQVLTWHCLVACGLVDCWEAVSDVELGPRTSIHILRSKAVAERRTQRWRRGESRGAEELFTSYFCCSLTLPWRRSLASMSRSQLSSRTLCAAFCSWLGRP